MNSRRFLPQLAVFVVLQSASALDLKRATVFAPQGTTAAAVETLTAEVARRTGIRMRMTSTWPPDGPVIAVVTGTTSSVPPGITTGILGAPAGDEGFRIHQHGGSLIVAGNSPRGT